MNNLGIETAPFARRTLILAVSLIVLVLMMLAFILGRSMTERINSITLIDHPAADHFTSVISPEIGCPRPGLC